MLNFNALPTEKPSNYSKVGEGTYTAVVFKTQMVKGKTSENEYLNVSFKLDDGGFVNENYFDMDKPFLRYKLGRLLNACGVTLRGEGTLKDVAKVITGKKVIIDVALNDRGYPCLDYTEDREGIYPIGHAAVETTTALDTELNQAIEADNQEDF